MQGLKSPYLIHIPNLIIKSIMPLYSRSVNIFYTLTGSSLLKIIVFFILKIKFFFFFFSSSSYSYYCYVIQ